MTQKNDAPAQPDPDSPGDESAASGEELSELEQAREALQAAEARAEENWDKYLRGAAELDNMRRRATRDIEHARKYGAEKFAAEMLNIKDSLEMGLEAATESADVESLRAGKAATLKMLQQALEKFGVAELDPLGEPFDPEVHEAMAMQECPGQEPGSVVTVVQKGYQLHERLLRPARVIVAKEAAVDGQESGGQTA